MNTFGIVGLLLPTLGLLIYLGSLALVLWVGYRLMRVAVKNGVLDADMERERRKHLATPPGWYTRPDDGAIAYWDGQQWTGATVDPT